jgi:hypothetical protein
VFTPAEADLASLTTDYQQAFQQLRDALGGLSVTAFVSRIEDTVRDFTQAHTNASQLVGVPGATGEMTYQISRMSTIYRSLADTLREARAAQVAGSVLDLVGGQHEPVELSVADQIAAELSGLGVATEGLTATSAELDDARKAAGRAIERAFAAKRDARQRSAAAFDAMRAAAVRANGQPAAEAELWKATEQFYAATEALVHTEWDQRANVEAANAAEQKVVERRHDGESSATRDKPLPLVPGGDKPLPRLPTEANNVGQPGTSTRRPPVKHVFVSPRKVVAHGWARRLSVIPEEHSIPPSVSPADQGESIRPPWFVAGGALGDGYVVRGPEFDAGGVRAVVDALLAKVPAGLFRDEADAYVTNLLGNSFPEHWNDLLLRGDSSVFMADAPSTKLSFRLVETSMR